MVDVRAVAPLAIPVTLKQIKADPELADMALIRQSRLSVCPVTESQWNHISRLAGLTEDADGELYALCFDDKIFKIIVP